MNMKNVPFLFVLACLFTLVLHAQHRPFVVEGKRWIVEYNESGMGYFHYYLGKKYCTSPMTYFIKGDTVIDGKAYKKLYQKCTMESGRDTTEYYSAIREDADGTVYQKREDFTENNKKNHEYTGEKQLYKFSSAPEYYKDWTEAFKHMLITDSYYSYSPSGHMAYRLQGTCQFKANEQPNPASDVSRFLYEYWNGISPTVNGSEMFHFVVIDGIGAIEKHHPFDFEIGSSTLIEVWENDELIYSKDWQMEKIAPEGIHSLQVISNDSDAPTYDLQGRRVENPKQGEIYIQKGKKIKK